MSELKPCPLVAVFGDPELEEQALARCPNRRPDPRVEKLVEALKDLLRTIDANGTWDERCFYYAGKNASELQAPMKKAAKALAEYEKEEK